MVEFLSPQETAEIQLVGIVSEGNLLTITQQYIQSNELTLAAKLGFNIWYQHSPKIAFAAGLAAQHSFYPPIFSEFRYTVLDNQNQAPRGVFWLESSLANFGFHTSCRYFW